MRPAAFYHKLVIVQLSANETVQSDKIPARLAWDWLAAACILACVFLASGRLVATNATENLFSVEWLAALACTFGLLLGVSHFKALWAAILAGIYGLFFIFLQFGIIFFPGLDWAERLRNLGGRLGFGLQQFADGENVSDPLLFLAAMALLFWMLGSRAGYALNRHGAVWEAVIPLGIVAVVVQTYDGAVAWRAWLLAGYVVCALMLVARVRLLRQKQTWEQKRAGMPADISTALASVVLGAALLVVLLAWATPALAASFDSAESFWSTVTSPWRTLQEHLGRALYPLQGTPVNRSSYFGSRLALGTSIPQSPTTLFTVRVLEQESVPLRYYWRDRVYDVYQNGRWESTLTQEQNMAGADLTLTQLTDKHTLARLAFTASHEIQLLHLPAQPVDLTRAATLLFAENTDGSVDVGGFFALAKIYPGETYEAVAALPPLYSNELRGAGSNYPEWVTERYLQLPADLSERTRHLAQRVTEGEDNPFDMAVAITDYLRENIEYVDQLPDPPANQELIDWMLFEQQQAFCNYYATAEVLMLRSLGIPARLAVGYAQGEREYADGESQFRVRQRHAHAWPEVYFPGVGWVEFEPTANQDALIRAELVLSDEPTQEEQQRELRQERNGLAPTGDEPEEQPEAGVTGLPSATSSWLGMILLLAGLGLLGTALFLQRRSGFNLALPTLMVAGLERLNIPLPAQLQQWSRYNELSALEQAYVQVNISLRRLGRLVAAGSTPRQRIDLLTAQLPALKGELDKLAGDYEARVYNRAPRVEQVDGAKLKRRIRKLTRHVQLKRMRERVFKRLKVKR